ncbi:TerB family tellurite resistance protein [Thioalkalivibrio sp. ALE23]|uniref:tellurite resistance TerB family protein n=1 Tax=Thioalkalivibrio sp. ALE23 TaxID=1265495 RepID=UPI00037B1703|nr:TerB family tellurite resistance protein [Thioalkalivibrio sp. ALE23]
MIEQLRARWQQLMRAERSDSETGDEQERLQRAAAALMMEVCRADFQLVDAELESVRANLIEMFGLDDEAADALLDIAREKSDALVSLHPVVREVNAAFNADQKAAIMKALWRSALANDELHKRQEAVIRHLADLLYVPHATFIRTKLAVLEERGEAPEEQGGRE